MPLVRNDKLTGGTGLDLVAYPGRAAVTIDLSGTAETAKRGGEKDTLIGMQVPWAPAAP